MTTQRPPAVLSSLVVAAVVLAALTGRAHAWNDTGHMLTALLAWEQMDEPGRAWAIGLIEQHPRFDEDFVRRMPPDVDAADRERWIFARAATWPDVARGFDGEDERRYHHSTWHYALAFHPLDDGRAPGTDETRRSRRGDGSRFGPASRASTRPSTRRAASRPATQPSTQPAVHIVEALEASLRALRDTDTAPPDRAIALCWVLHLCGDIHQPCHAGSLLSERFPLPEGDRGANHILIEGEGRSGNLHSVWDGMAGDNRALPVLSMKVGHLLTDPTLGRTALPELAKHPAAKDWLAESGALSRDTVYDYSVRSAIRLQDLDVDAPFVPIRLSRNYTADARMVAERRIALAGHRIADALRGIVSK